MAVELIDDTLKRPESGYETLVAVDGPDEDPLGYTCFGRTPMTQQTWDLYWIAVDPATQGRGVGKQLLAAFEELIRHRTGTGTIVRVETSSQEEYDGTVAFYLRNAYETIGRIKGFYRADDDLLILAKTLA